MVTDAEQIFQELYKDVDGMTISSKSRQSLDHWYIGHTYGEVTYEGFLRMLAVAQPKAGGVFYDLGSGTGKAVYLAALLGRFSKTVGIEILKELCDSATELLPKFRELTGNISTPSVSFIRGDFKELDFSDADVIFMNATCMQYEFDIPFIRRLEGLKNGTRILTNTIYFESDQYSLHSIGPVPFTWGEEEVFIHEKI